MLLLTSVADKIQVITDTAVTTDVHASWVDYAAGAVTPGRKNSAITTATTTDVVPSPAASTQRNVKCLVVRNRHPVDSVVVTVQHTDGSIVSELMRCTLLTWECLAFNDGTGFQIFESTGAVKTAVINPANATETPTAGKIPIANGSGDLDPGWINMPSGESVLGASYTITADTTWQDTGLSITLPAAGTYIIAGNVQGYAKVSATPGASISVKLYNSTDAADVANSERLVAVASAVNQDHASTGSWFIPVPVAASKVIKVYAYRTAATLTYSQIQSVSNGRTNLTYVRIQ